jgi:NAD(P)-dependent dehydrogenase (short-subunit alcohol dehydrogenase family)
VRRYLVVGGTSGIGRSLAAHLTSRGGHVYTMSRGEHGAEHADVAGHWQCDVVNPETPLPELGAPLDGLAYLPGTITLKPFARLQSRDLLNDLQVNYLSAIRVVQHFLDDLKRAENASVVLMSTVAVRLGLPYHASIAGAKGAVEGLTRALAAELAPRIRVNAVAPSLLDTPLAGPLLATDRKREEMARRHPAKTIGDPAKVASLIAFLLSDDASWMTGQIVAMDGGMGSVRTA